MIIKTNQTAYYHDNIVYNFIIKYRIHKNMILSYVFAFIITINKRSGSESIGSYEQLMVMFIYEKTLFCIQFMLGYKKQEVSIMNNLYTSQFHHHHWII